MSNGVLAMKHDCDPKMELQEKVGSVDGVHVMHNNILVAIYKRPELTRGGIALPGQTLKEDIYQGKVGLVLKTGPLAFMDDERNKFHGEKVEIGDWIIFRVQDGWTLTMAGKDGPVPCRMLEDVHVKGKIAWPDDVY